MLSAVLFLIALSLAFVCGTYTTFFTSNPYQGNFYNLTLWNFVEVISQVGIVLFVGFLIQKKLQFSDKIFESLISDLKGLEDFSTELNSLAHRYNVASPEVKKLSFIEINSVLKKINQRFTSFETRCTLWQIRSNPERITRFNSMKKEITGGDFGSSNHQINLIKSSRAIEDFISIIDDLKLSIFRKIKD